MRLFVAVRFDRATEDFFHRCTEALRERTVSGVFTQPENLHLTLAFLGEMENAHPAAQAVREVQGDAFSLSFGGLGRFRRDGGDIFWIGVEDNPALLAVYRSLWAALARHGLPADARPYRPHLTLGRRVVAGKDFDSARFPRRLTQRRVSVDTITLMQSGRIQGTLTYTPLLEQPLGATERTVSP